MTRCSIAKKMNWRIPAQKQKLGNDLKNLQNKDEQLNYTSDTFQEKQKSKNKNKSWNKKVSKETSRTNTVQKRPDTSKMGI